MKIWLKRVLFSLVILVIAALVGIAIFLLTFDPNAYKNKLEELVYNRYHRTLSINGDIELSLFPRIGLSVQGLSLTDRDSANVFASLDSARFAVAIWPLMSNRLVVDHVAVTGFKAWVTRDSHGDFNFSDLTRGGGVVGLPAGTPEPRPAAPEAKSGHSLLPAGLARHDASGTDFQIDIAGLDLKNGEIHFYDQKSGSILRIVQLDVNTGRMTFDQAFDVAVKGRLRGDYPAADAAIEGQALIKLNPDLENYSAQKLNVQLRGKVGNLDASAATLRGNLAYGVYSRMFSASGLEFVVQGALNGETPVKNLSASLTAPQLKVDRSQAQLRVEKLALRATGQLPTQHFDVAFDAPGLSISPEAANGDPISGTVKLSGERVVGLKLGLSGLGGDAQNLTLKELKADGSLKQGDRLVQMKFTSPASWSRYEEKGGLSAIKGDVRVEDKALPTGSFEFPLIGSLHADLVEDQIASDINAIISGSQFEFSLRANELSKPRIAFDLSADKLDFNTLFPPATPKPAPPHPPAQTGEKAPAKPAAPAKAAPAEAKEKPAAPAPVPNSFNLSFLNSVDIMGNVKVGDLKMRDFSARQVSAAVRASKGELEISRLMSTLYQGTLSGKILAKSDNSLSAQLSLDNVEMGAFLHDLAHEDRLVGLGSAKIDLSTRGTTPAALRAGLDGTVSLRVRDGAVRGINIAQTLREADEVIRNVFSGQLPEVSTKLDMSRRTDFSALDADVQFQQGQGSIQKLSLDAPLVRVSEGKPASLDLVNEQMDVMLNVRLVNTKTGQDGKALEELKDVTVPVRLSGPFDNPAYQVQWKEIRSQAVKQAVRDGLLDLLSHKLQPGEAAPQPGAAPPAAPPQPSKPADAVKSIGEALKGLLGK